jgi:uncharacterized membrane protein YphA (DoxX/SURF4 family)
VKRLLAIWQAYWFPRTTSLNLAGARIVAVAAELFWFFPSLSTQINLATSNTEFSRPQPLIRLIDLFVPRDMLYTADGMTAVYWLTFAAGLFALVGLFTRTSLFLLALGVWFFVSHGYSYADIHHPQAVFAIFLMLLPFSPAGERLSVDAWLRRRSGRAPQAPVTTEMAMWPLRVAHVLLSLTYFSTGITKLMCCGLEWMNGYTLQNHIFSDAIDRGIPIGLWLANQHTLCILLAIATIGFELFYFTSILFPRIAPLWFVGGILFHVGLYVTSGHPFFEHIALNLIMLLFLDADWFPRTFRALVGTGGAAPAQQPT